MRLRIDRRPFKRIEAPVDPPDDDCEEMTNEELERQLEDRNYRQEREWERDCDQA